jgi:hypothetical protein
MALNRVARVTYDMPLAPHETNWPLGESARSMEEDIVAKQAT